ncbi:3249_t:CDS:2, partial [Gigaspora rosea]
IKIIPQTPEQKFEKAIKHFKFLQEQKGFLKLYGFTRISDDSLAVVMERATQGNFNEYLKNHPFMDWEEKLNILRNIC